MTEGRQVFQIPTHEIFIGCSDIEVEVGKLAVIGFIDQDFVLPTSYRTDENELKAWPKLLLDVKDDSFSPVSEAYRLVPDYFKNDGKWRLYHGWDTAIQYENGQPRLWAGNQDAYFWPTPRPYNQRKLQLAVSSVMRRPWVSKS